MAANSRTERDLVTWFDDEVGNLKEHMACGNCENFAEYRYVCGQIQGLRNAQAEWAATTAEEEEDEEV